MVFDKEAAFEEAVITVLKQHGWDDAGGVLRYPTEQDLIDNWAKILFQNNADIDRLNGCPLTQGEMAQVIEQIETLKTPLALNGFINGKTVAITRDNPDDALHLGKEVSLKIYDRQEIAAGQSRYQIAQQPVYPAKSKILNDRRGDLCLLINGMPVIHIELKRSGIPVSQATGQIEKYAREGVFTGLFRLTQIFVGMTPDEARARSTRTSSSTGRTSTTSPSARATNPEQTNGSASPPRCSPSLWHTSSSASIPWRIARTAV